VVLRREFSMKKAHLVVPQKNLSILPTILINTGAAIVVQIVFAITLFVLFKQILNTKGLTDVGYYHLMVTAILVDCIGTTMAIVITERLVEKIFLSGESDLIGREMNRAMYFAVIGILGVGILRAFADARVEFVWGMVPLCAILFFFGGYHKKFREARRGIWFPHSAFHFGIQQLALFPASLWVINQILGGVSP
jgi:hypothetical protein